METFEEIQPWGSTRYTIESGSHIHKKTERATIDIFTNPFFGRMLFIDGVLQSCEKDEKVYHEALVNYCKPKGSVLIAGGAEGATAREVLAGTYKISKVVMVDWDKDLVGIMRQEVFCKGVFENPLLEVVHEDIMKYLTTSNIYDSILIDLLDPHTEDEIKWLSAVCVLAFTRLETGGTLVVNAGGKYDIMVKLIHMMEEKTYCRTDYTVMFIPSFQELWYLIKICKL